MEIERLISSDSHVGRSHDDVKAHLATKFHDAYDEATGAFAQRSATGNAGAQAANMQRYNHPARGRPGHHDPHARLEDMDIDGVDAEVLYCDVSAYRYLYKMKEGWQEGTRAFNDALVDFASVDPKRLVVSYQIPIHEIDVAVQEVERVAELGGKSLQLPVFPAELGFDDYFHERYDPLWSAIQAADLPICCHIGHNAALDDLQRRDPTPQNAVMVPMAGMSAGEALGMWVVTGVLERFSGLKVVFVEPGLGWVAWYLYIIDDMATRQKYDLPGITELPSFYFKRNVFLTFIEEPDAVQLLRHRLGTRNIMWSTDYPHPVSSWPNSRKIAAEQTAGMSAEDRDLVLAGNAARVWNL